MFDGMSPMLALGWHTHAMFGLALFIGLVLFVAWAIKHLKKDVLGKWVLWLVVIGLVGMLLTAPFAWQGMNHKMDNWKELKGYTTTVQ